MTDNGKLSLNEAICAILLAFIFSLNAVSTVFPAYRTVLTYMIFGMFIVFTVLTTSRHLRFRIHPSIAWTLVLYLIWSFITMEIYGTGAEGQYVKFILCIIVAIMAGTLNTSTRMTAIRISIVISTFFAIYCILRYDQINRAVIYTNAGNRLTVTLPMALGLMFALIGVLVNRASKIRSAFYIFSIIVQTIALLSYSARGNLIFPYVVFAIMLIVDSRNNRRVIIRNLFLLILGGLSFYFLFTRYASVGMINRLTRLFTQTERESRIPVYHVYIEDLTRNIRYIVGSGFGRSAEILQNAGYTAYRYPHNLFLELIGEGGLFGIALVIASISEVIKSEKIYFSRLNAIEWSIDSLLTQEFFLVNGGFLFYLFSYFKSYSIYDGYQLFIFMSMILSIKYLENNDAQ